MSKIGLGGSVTRWVDYFSLFGFIQQLKFPQNWSKVANVGSKFCQTLNKPSKVCKRFLKVCPSSKISPNLVTLFGGRPFIAAANVLHFPRNESLEKIKCFCFTSSTLKRKSPPRYQCDQIKIANLVTLLGTHLGRKTWLVISETRLGDFWKFWATNFLIKVAQIFGNFQATVKSFTFLCLLFGQFFGKNGQLFIPPFGHTAVVK